ncbi:MAG: hypothetical protein Q9217_004788 [Psora testacea]
MANLETPIPKLKLNDGTSIPMADFLFDKVFVLMLIILKLGYGTGTAWYKSSDDGSIDRTTVEAIKTALKLCYTHIDAAEVYNTEPEVGIAIKESKIPRENLYTAWAAMETVKASGKALSIGVSNFLVPQLEAILKTATVPPSINQIEYHPYLQHGPLLPFHKEKGITTAAYGALTAVTKAKPGPVDHMMAELAKKYYVTEGEREGTKAKRLLEGYDIQTNAKRVQGSGRASKIGWTAGCITKSTNGDMSTRSEKVAMQSIVLQLFPDEDPPTQHLSHEEKLAYVGMNIELHEREVRSVFGLLAGLIPRELTWLNRDRIRLIAAYEKEHSATSPEEDPPRFLQPSDEHGPDAFRSAIRQCWRRPAPKPTVKQNARSQSFFNRNNACGQVGVAKRAVSRLESHKKVIEPVLEQLRQAEAKGNAGSPESKSQVGTPVLNQHSDLRQGE